MNDQAPSPARLCGYCHAPMGRPRRPGVAKHGRGKYCSRRCAGLANCRRGRISTAEKNRRYAKAYPWKRAANTKVKRAIANGALQRQPCVRCGAAISHGHHDDYSKPLDVMWLCPKHHTERHAELAAMRTEAAS